MFVKSFFIDENRLTEFDMECYKCAVHNFRMVGCSKHGKNAFLKIFSDHTHLDCMICHIPKTCKLLEHLHLFIEESYDYGDCVNWGISFYKAKLPIDTFLEFSKVGDDKYNEKTAIKKWNSFKYEQNAGDLFNRLKKKGSDVSTFAKMK